MCPVGFGSWALGHGRACHSYLLLYPPFILSILFWGDTLPPGLSSCICHFLVSRSPRRMLFLALHFVSDFG